MRNLFKNRSFFYITGIQYISLMVLLLYLSNCSGEKTMNHKPNYEKLRGQMVERQIRARGIKNTMVLNAMNEIPRHRFIPDSYLDLAYSDQPLPIGSGQTISQPYIVAFMSEQLQLTSESKVLEIGTGSGYQAAVLGAIVDSVFTIEIVPELANSAKNLINELGYKNIIVKQGDGYAGWPDKAPFDAIMVTAAPSKIPPPLLEQLKIGAKMVLPVGEFRQELVVVTKTKSSIEMENVLPVRFVPMTGKIQNEQTK